MKNFGPFVALFALALFFGAVSQARASTGTVTGSFFFTQVQGNCSNTAAGSKFPCTERNTNRPVQNAEVFVQRASDGAWLGMNYSDNNGNFSVGWTDNSTSGNVAVNVIWRARVQGNRFEVGASGATGNNWFFWINSGSGSQVFTATNGGTTNIGWFSWGANPHANVYDGANKLWKSIAISNRLNSFFGAATPKCMSGFSCTSRTVIMIDDVGNGNSPRNGSCNANSAAYADARDNYVCLSNDDVGHFANLSRVMHELGHIAEYVSNRDQRRGNSADYRRDDPQPFCTNNPSDTASCNIHTLLSQEWNSAGWQEGVATHFAHIALYDTGATTPNTCVSSGTCDTAFGRQNVETSNLDCVNQSRAELGVQRYLWDTYDSVSDSRILNGTTWTDSLSRGIWEVSDTIHAFDPGTGGAQRDEAPSDPDGRSSRDFNHNWWVWGTDSWPQLQMNCEPSGSDI